MTKILSFIFILLFPALANSTTLMILGDSLSAGYNMPIEQSWPSLLNEQLDKHNKSRDVINASISGDTSGNGLARLPDLLAQHKPASVLIELGANDGLRGFSPAAVTANIEKMIMLIKAQNAQVILMQIEVPPNYGKRYSQAFSSLYPKLSEKHAVPLLPFFLEQVILKPQWMMKDGLHPTVQAQPWIAQFMAKELTPYLK
ncbi:multifunctional acyl-CoA thioesterase I/protease I/lysophospholipase L1 [Psychromonas ossibalaenae]|uniref:multifunctional acyl-CoA thioesterase I/protease I/lysophospholipase L1 n=1 Tax=Psychromonas ossibalaenae TaxID=444922 RepID=UPI00036BE189|nr:multifunctional acyl-CoA thioesterase I/protease I/lysophospholipase L1 [Psychromonas ossibalaenae]